MNTPRSHEVRHLHLVLADQLDLNSVVFEGFDAETDAVWMAEVEEGEYHEWCHKLRVAFSLSAMRHFRSTLEETGKQVHYTALSARAEDDRGASLSEVLRRDVEQLRPEKLILVHPGDYRVKEELVAEAKQLGIELEIREDGHFYDTIAGFGAWAEGRKVFLLEHYYRHMRKRHEILLESPGEPEGGAWNYDKENREAFDRKGPVEIPAVCGFPADAVSEEVVRLVKKRFDRNPGLLDDFDLPVNREDALVWLEDFIANRLPKFGAYQDAMWAEERTLYHSRLSCLLNVKLLEPRECVERAVEAYRKQKAPLNSVEGFVRQILGWREFVRGVYWLRMPDYLGMNFLGAKEDLPSFFWDGKTDMRCVRDAMENVLRHGYAHHIQRLMVLGLFAQLFGVHPRSFHDWHMAMYLDAVDWVSAPNTIGMSQFADGGVVGTKPYCASGNYIHRMSNHCGSCKFKPGEATGERACPFTTFYWDFLGRNHDKLRGNRRMVFQLKNYERKSSATLEAISRRAERLRRAWA